MATSTTPQNSKQMMPARDFSNTRAQICPDRGLHAIFSFLVLSDVSSASAACRRWSAAVETEPMRGLRVRVSSVHQLREVCDSLLRRHVSTLDLSASGGLLGGDLPSLLCRQMTITQLICTTSAEQLADDKCKLVFPDTLRVLDVTLTWCDGTTAEELCSPFDALVAAAVRPPLTHLRVNASGNIPVHTIERLRELRETITDIHFAGRYNLPMHMWPAAHIAVFRSLPHLTRISAGALWCDEQLEMLMAEPAPRQLQSIDSVCTSLTPGGAAALARLSSLRELSLQIQMPEDIHDETSAAATDLQFIANMAHLEKLTFWCPNEIDPDVLSSALAHCTHMTQLDLGHKRLTNAHLCELLSSLGELCKLTISCTELDDLSFLSPRHLAGRLESLQITADSIPPRALGYLRTLRRLRELNLKITLALPHAADTSDDNVDADSMTLSSLETLKLYLRGKRQLDLGLLGRMPRLRTCTITSEASLVLCCLAHSPDLTELTIRHEITDADLCGLLAYLTNLRTLNVTSFALSGLSFASSSARLGATLTHLTLNAGVKLDARPSDLMPQRDLRHLRSLTALRQLRISSIAFKTDPLEYEPSESADDGGATLSSLESLELRPTGLFREDRLVGNSTVDLTLLGPMPNLRSAVIESDRPRFFHLPAILMTLRHCTALEMLQFGHPNLTNQHLTDLLPVFTNLHQLSVSTEADLVDLSFASAVPRLRTTLTDLTVEGVLSGSDLRHLHTLTGLRDLYLIFRARDSPLIEVARAELAFALNTNPKRFRLDSNPPHPVWPCMRNAAISVF